MVPGAVLAFIFPSIVLPYMGVDQGRWIKVMTIIGLLTIPAVLLQYYFSRERLTEEAQEDDSTPVISLLQQVKGCLSSKYWIMIMVSILIFQLYNNFAVNSLHYYSNWVLGTYNDGRTLSTLNIIGQAMLGPGVIFMWPLVGKFGKKKVYVAGCAIAAVGGVIGFFCARNFGMVLLALTIRSIGALPITYVTLAMLADALDHVEWKNGFRCDGFSSSVYSIIITVSTGIAMGILNMGLAAFGYIPPAADGSWVPQNEAMQNFFICGVFLVPAVGMAVIGIILHFFKVEDEMPRITADILERHKAELAARGEVYISPEEKACIQQEEMNRLAEQKRLEELRAKCSAKGLNFEEENQKYLQKVADQKAKAEASAEKKRIKEAKRAAKAKK